MTQFWGPRYRSYFVDYCLPSLLAANNLPLLCAADGHCFLIATPREDWEAIEHLPNMDYVRQFATPVFLETPAPAESDYAAILRHQTFSLKSLFEAAYARNGYGCAIWPDTMMSDGFIRAMQRWVKAGYRIVMQPTVRLAEEGVLADLRSQKILPEDKQLSMTTDAVTIPPRVVGDLSVRHLHPELENLEYGHPAQLPHAPYRFWRMPDQRGLILHVFFATPVLMDFAVVPANHAECLDCGDWETFYVGQNFSHCGGLYVVTDSDEAGILSITPSGVNRAVSKPTRRFGDRWMPGFTLLCDLRGSLGIYARDQRNRVRRELFRASILWHAEDIDETWRRKERQILELIDRAAGDYYADPNRIPPRITLDRRFLPLDLFIEIRNLCRIVGNCLWIIFGSLTGNREDASKIRRWLKKLSFRNGRIPRARRYQW